MKIDHLVVNIDEKYQKDLGIVEDIRNSRLIYEPKYGKGAKGFKASNIWVGDEYFELVNIINKDGGGWVSNWTELYNNGHRGLICLMLDVDDVDNLYKIVKKNNIIISEPRWLEFKWFFNLLNRRMPWKNSYIPFFEKVPLQIGFQEMKDQKSKEFMSKYMQPNSRDNGIEGITEIFIYGKFSRKDFEMLDIVFDKNAQSIENGKIVKLEKNQKVYFIKNDSYKVIVHTISNFRLTTNVENIEIIT